MIHLSELLYFYHWNVSYSNIILNCVNLIKRRYLFIFKEWHWSYTIQLRIHSCFLHWSQHQLHLILL